MTALRAVPRPITIVVGAVLAWLVAGAVLPDGAPLGVVLQGVVFGTVTALLAMGLILIYRTSNIVNFAYGAMGGVGGILAVNLYLASGLPYFLAVGIGVLTGVLVGGLVTLAIWMLPAIVRRLLDERRSWVPRPIAPP